MSDNPFSTGELLPTSADLKKGYFPPELSSPDDERVKTVARQLDRPRYILNGIKSYIKELQDDASPVEIKAGRLRAVAEKHGGPVLAQMFDALENGKEDIAAIEAKREEYLKPADAETQNRLNQIRNEIGRLDRPSQISAIESAIRDQDETTLKAVCSLPHNEAICPRQSYERAKQSLNQIALGDDALVLDDLRECVSRLAFARESFKLDLLDYRAFHADPGKEAFTNAMNANFERAGE
ncbi:hypothetical protein [Hyphococcus sp.]|uniref:hypothetical protein n=1 Tax=Hyphococcus sp. TaxID=2038636 RepID=UPI0035C6662B